MDSCNGQGIAQYNGLMSNRPAARTTVRRPGAGVTIDRTRLIRLRELRLLSRAQLAALMSEGDDDFTITPDAIAKIENGYRRPKTVTLGKLCEVLGCYPEDLLPETDRQPEPCPKCRARFGHEPGCEDAT